MTQSYPHPRWLLASLVLVSACAEEAPTTEAPLRPVIYESVGSASADSERTFSGTAVSGRAVNLSFRSSGVVTELNIRRRRLRLQEADHE